MKVVQELHIADMLDYCTDVEVWLSFQDTDTLFAYLSAILHLTDIRFETDSETDGVYIADEYW